MGIKNAMNEKTRDVETIIHPVKQKHTQSEYKALINNILARQKRVREALQELDK